jgi:hypothetical protein
MATVYKSDPPPARTAADEQKDDLVKDILTTFGNPAQWPMTDAERCMALRKWYRMAVDIQAAERDASGKS